jgi:hypothetical protein
VKVPTWVKAIGAAFAALAAVWAARWAYEELASVVGHVGDTGTSFARIKGDPSKLDVWVDGTVKRVVLPEGMRSDQVRAVRVAEGGAATVEILP